MAGVITLAALNGAGVRIALTVPAGTQVLQVGVGTVPGVVVAKAKKEDTKSRVLYREMRHITKHGPWKKAHRVVFRLRSKALARKLHHGQRLVLELRAGRNTKALGKMKTIRFRVR